MGLSKFLSLFLAHSLAPKVNAVHMGYHLIDYDCDLKLFVSRLHEISCAERECEQLMEEKE